MLVRATLLLLALALCASSALSQSSVNISYAARAFHGWAPWTISANRVNESALIIDSGLWVKIVHTGQRPGPPGPLPLTVGAPVDPSISSFNLTAYGAHLDLIAAGQWGHAWLIAVTPAGPSQWNDYLIYADLHAQTIKANVSLATFNPKVGGNGYVEGIAVDASDNLYAVQGNNVWEFDITGKQVNYFALAGSAAPIVSIDVDGAGSLWVLEDFNSTTQANRLMQYSDSGELIGSSNLNFSDIRYRDYLIDVTVDSRGVAYIAAVGEARVLVWNTANNTRGNDIRLRGVGPRAEEEYFYPQLALVNDSTLLVAEWHMADIAVINLRDLRHSRDIPSPQAVMDGPYTIFSIRNKQSGSDSLVVELDHSIETQAVAIDSRDGGLRHVYGFPNDIAQRGWTLGLTVDLTGVVYVSQEYYYNSTFRQVVHIFGESGSGGHARSLSVTAAGLVAVDTKNQRIWIADDTSNGPDTLIQSFDLKYGRPISSLNLTTAGAGYLSDLKLFEDPSTGANLVLIVSDFVNNQLIAVNSTGAVVGKLPTGSLQPLAFHLDLNSGLAFVAGITFTNNGLTLTSQISVFDPSGKLIEILYPPAGWPTAAMFGVVADESGTVYATLHDFDAVIEFPRPHHRNRTNSELSWYAGSPIEPQTSMNVLEIVAETPVKPSRESVKPHRRVESYRR